MKETSCHIWWVGGWVGHRNCACNILGNSSHWQYIARDWPAMEIPRKVETWGYVTTGLIMRHRSSHIRDYHNSLDGRPSAWSRSRQNAFKTWFILVAWCYHMSRLGRHWFQTWLKSDKYKSLATNGKRTTDVAPVGELAFLPSLPSDTFTPPCFCYYVTMVDSNHHFAADRDRGLVYVENCEYRRIPLHI